MKGVGSRSKNVCERANEEKRSEFIPKASAQKGEKRKFTQVKLLKHRYLFGGFPITREVESEGCCNVCFV